VKLAVIGDPIDHSRSPQLHRGFLREAGIEGSYVAIRVPVRNAISVVRRMRMDAYTGCNVTYPLKEEVLLACDVLLEPAQRAGAVNTILFGREVLGTNTDGVGARLAVEAALEESIALKRIGVLGYGATARAILAEFHDNDAYTFVWGRDEKKIADVCERYEAQPWPDDNPPEIVISTLPPDVRLGVEMVRDLQAADVVFDANYGERETLARQVEREVISGEAMLEAQARASFDFWLAHIEGLDAEPPAS
jgi:shikimate dehydrogenase